MYEYRGNVVKVYDGDTIYVDIDLGFKTWIKGMHLRLLGIDCPEIKGVERVDGLLARDAMSKLVMGKSVTVRTTKPPAGGPDSADKYGRYLAVIVLDDGTNVNDFMILNGFAERYMV